MFLGTIAVIVGGILFIFALQHADEGQRQQGRGRMNRLLTNFGGGSFGEGVRATFGELTHNCLSGVFWFLCLVCLIFAFKSCSNDTSKSVNSTSNRLNNTPDRPEPEPTPIVQKEQPNSRKYIRDRIAGWNSCRLVALTTNGGNVAIAGDNGWAICGSFPTELRDALRRVSNDGCRITDVCLTDEGKWVILLGEEGFLSNDLPEKMYNMLSRYHRNLETLISATLNDKGDWVVISDSHYGTSSNEIRSWLRVGVSKYGRPWSVSITNEAKVAVFERGYSFSGNYPRGVREAINQSQFDARVIKIADDNSWFFADETGNFRYSM